MEVEQAPCAPVIARCYLAILSIEHDLPHNQKLDVEAVTILAIANRVSSVKSNRRMAVNCMTFILDSTILNLFYYMKCSVKKHISDL